MEIIASLHPNNSRPVRVGFAPNMIKTLSSKGVVDTLITAADEGFTPLGFASTFLEQDLGVPFAEIRSLADWSRSRNDQVTVIGIPSRRKDSQLRGLILAPCENSISYRRYAKPQYGKPFRDFYYNVTYEAIALAHAEWGAQKFAMSHLSLSNRFHEDIATCNAEALAHFCDENPNAGIESFVFTGCCIEKSHLNGIARLNAESKTGHHHPVNITKSVANGYTLVHIDWGGSG
ncbi:MAG: hypothetical protein K8R50_10375 [Betaproteobacteria bacterium]|nr:hypothetical protein [Betaproteobacteria bacterium]